MEDLEWASGGTSVALLIKRNPVQITLSAQGIGELLIALPVRLSIMYRLQSMPWCQHSVLGKKAVCCTNMPPNSISDDARSSLWRPVAGHELDCSKCTVWLANAHHLKVSVRMQGYACVCRLTAWMASVARQLRCATATSRSTCEQPSRSCPAPRTTLQLYLARQATEFLGIPDMRISGMPQWLTICMHDLSGAFTAVLHLY